LDPLFIKDRKTMSKIAPHDYAMQLQKAVWQEISQLNLPRLPVMEMEVELCVSNSFDTPPRYIKQDLCKLIQNHKLSNAVIYFSSKYNPDEKGRRALFNDLLRTALDGGDSLTLWGKGKGKGQSMYIKCQCAVIYRGGKVDKNTGSIVDRLDYRTTTFCGDRKNQRHGQKGTNGSHRTTFSSRTSKADDGCPFRLAVFLDHNGYYIKASRWSTVLHQFHARRDHLRIPTTLIHAEDHEIQQDMNSARAKTGISVNLHYVRTGRKGTPTVLSQDQVKAMCKKFSRSQQKGNAEDIADKVKNSTGEIDDLYEFLEESGCHYVSLLARAAVPDKGSNDPAGSGKAKLFNETRTGSYMGQEDANIAGDEEQEMLRIVSDHRRELKIDDSQEMMVGLAFAVPFEIRQFELFHVCLHIDATSDSNKEGRPLVTLSSKDSYGNVTGIMVTWLFTAGPCF
jgi:hypothetical protein